MTLCSTMMILTVNYHNQTWWWYRVSVRNHFKETRFIMKKKTCAQIQAWTTMFRITKAISRCSNNSKPPAKVHSHLSISTHHLNTQSKMLNHSLNMKSKTTTTLCHSINRNYSHMSQQQTTHIIHLWTTLLQWLSIQVRLHCN